MGKTLQTVMAISLISLGVLGILNNFGFIDVSLYDLWPVAIWILGFGFELSYFKNRKEPGYLVPGGIFMTIAFIFTMAIIFGWRYMSILWPLFILAPAIGLFQLYLFHERDKDLLIPVGILGTIGGFFLIINLMSLDAFKLIGAGVLIVIGIILLLGSRKK